MGLSQGMALGDAVHTYTVLTVGDGLVTQIPALFISICAGIVVTRVSSAANTTLGVDVGAQLFNKPALVLFTGSVLFIAGVLPGLPHIPFLTVGGLFMLTGFLMRNQTVAASASLLPGRIDYVPTTVIALDSYEEESAAQSIVTLRLDAGLLSKVYLNEQQEYHSQWREFQTEFYAEVGLKLPELNVQPDDQLPPCSYALSVNQVLVESNRLLLDSVLVELSPQNAALLGLQVLSEEDHPLNGARVFWAANTQSLRRVTAAAGIKTLDFVQFVFLKLAAFFITHPEELLSLSDVHASLKDLEKKYPGLTEEVLQRNFVNHATLTEILLELVREGVSIKDFRQIVEALAGYCTARGVTRDDPSAFDLDDAVNFVRQSRKRQLVSKLLSDRNTLRVCTLAENIENALEEGGVSGDNLGIDIGTFEKMRSQLGELVDLAKTRGTAPVVVLCRTDLRSKVSRFLRSVNKRLGVISYDELDPRVSVEPIGVWGL